MRSATGGFSFQSKFRLCSQAVRAGSIPVGAFAGRATDWLMGDTWNPFMMAAVTLPFLDNDLDHVARIIA